MKQLPFTLMVIWWYQTQQSGFFLYHRFWENKKLFSPVKHVQYHYTHGLFSLIITLYPKTMREVPICSSANNILILLKLKILATFQENIDEKAQENLFKHSLYSSTLKYSLPRKRCRLRPVITSCYCHFIAMTDYIDRIRFDFATAFLVLHGSAVMQLRSNAVQISNLVRSL